MATICAWCQGLIERAAARRQPDASAPASHGICPACLQRQLDAVQAERPARAA